jgi:hypothetical protein
VAERGHRADSRYHDAFFTGTGEVDAICRCRGGNSVRSRALPSVSCCPRVSLRLRGKVVSPMMVLLVLTSDGRGGG